MVKKRYLCTMILEKLSVINYKNIAEATLEFSPKINCLIGQNGVGKTNVLDAIYYLSFCHSANNPIDSQVIKHGYEFFVLEGSYEGDLHIYCGMKRGVKKHFKRKHFKRNKKEYRRLSEHIGLIPIVVVSPSDTLLIEGGSEERRRLMDMVISQYNHGYMDAMNRYNKALQQRNSLLKMDEEPDPMLMQIWEEQMAAEGESIYEKRKASFDARKPTEVINEDRELLAYPFDIGMQYPEDVFPLKRYRIGDYDFWGPINPDRILTMRYGKYMELPPVEARIPHFGSVTFIEKE